MIRKSKLLGILQIIVALTLFFTFFAAIPWLVADPISNIRRSPNMARKFPPPSWAKSYSVNHGKPTYYSDYCAEEPGKVISLIALLAGQLAFLIISAIYSYKIKTNTSWKNAVTNSLQELNTRSNS